MMVTSTSAIKLSSEELLRQMRDPEYVRPKLHFTMGQCSQAVLNAFDYIGSCDELTSVVELRDEADIAEGDAYLEYQGKQYGEGGISFMLEMIEGDVKAGRLQFVQEFMASQAGY